MPTLCKTNQCTGCGACAAVCKHNAIIFKEDSKGFIYPYINTDRCVECKLCEKTCPILSTERIKLSYPLNVIACHDKKLDERSKSSSGGIATLLSKTAVINKKFVYGCKFSDGKFKHVKCKDINELETIRGSKYVQSDIIGIYESIRQDIKNGKEVIFIGTPCQTAGIRSIFKDKVILIDLICHGIPSYKFLYNSLPERFKINSDIDEIKFRVNSKYNFQIINKSRNIIYERELTNDIFMKGFFNGVIFRPSCHECKFAQSKRVGDITLGDFWGLKSNLITDISNGVSLVLINSSKGNEIFNEIKDDIIYEEKTFDEAKKKNKQLSYPIKKNIRAILFNKLYDKIGFKLSIWCSLPDKMTVMKIKHLFKNIKR